MLDFYRTPAGKRLVDETLPEIAEQLGRIADLALVLVQSHMESQGFTGGGNSEEACFLICRPFEDPLNGISCSVVADGSEPDIFVVSLEPADVLSRFLDGGYRKSEFQDPWGINLWFEPGKYYAAVHKDHLMQGF